MPKFIRQVMGGTWLKLETNDRSDSYWIRPTCPEATKMIKQKHLVREEKYDHSLAEEQRGLV